MNCYSYHEKMLEVETKLRKVKTDVPRGYNKCHHSEFGSIIKYTCGLHYIATALAGRISNKDGYH